MPAKIELADFPEDSYLVENARVEFHRGNISEDQPWFLRSIGLYAPFFRDKTLEEIVAIGDREFERVAKMCGAAVIEHTWGLMPYRNGITGWSTNSGIVPKNHRLVAEVRNIVPIKQQLDFRKLRRGMSRYNNRRFTGVKLSDIDKDNQFVFGTPAGSNLKPGNHLVDLDLYFC